MAIRFSCSDSRVLFSRICSEFEFGDSRIEMTVFDRLSGPLLRLVQSRLSKHYQAKTSAEDIVQATFMSFVRRHKKKPFDIENVEVMWSIMSTIAIRKCQNEIRKYQRAKRDIKKEVGGLGGFRDSGEQKAFENSALVSREPTPQRRVESQERFDKILNSLNKKQREVALFRLRGYNNDEIAKRMNISERSVYRVLDKIRFQIIRMEQLLERK